MRRIVLRWLISALAVYVADVLVPGIAAEGWSVYLWMALILSLANALVAPLLRLLTCPLILLTLGLFSLVINALMLRLAAAIAAHVGLAFTVEGWLPAFWGALIISLAGTALRVLFRTDHDDDER